MGATILTTALPSGGTGGRYESCQWQPNKMSWGNNRLEINVNIVSHRFFSVRLSAVILIVLARPLYCLVRSTTVVLRLINKCDPIILMPVMGPITQFPKYLYNGGVDFFPAAGNPSLHNSREHTSPNFLSISVNSNTNPISVCGSPIREFSSPGHRAIKESQHYRY